MVPDVTSQPPQAIPVDDAVSELARKTYKKSTFFLMQLQYTAPQSSRWNLKGECSEKEWRFLLSQSFPGKSCSRMHDVPC